MEKTVWYFEEEQIAFSSLEKAEEYFKRIIKGLKGPVDVSIYKQGDKIWYYVNDRGFTSEWILHEIKFDPIESDFVW